MQDTLGKLRALGAETICGDLYLDRVKVGYFREGVFIPTADAQSMIDEKTPKAKVEKPVPAETSKPEATTKPAKGKKGKEKTEPETPETPETTTDTGAAETTGETTGAQGPDDLDIDSLLNGN